MHGLIVFIFILQMEREFSKEAKWSHFSFERQKHAFEPFSRNYMSVSKLKVVRSKLGYSIVIPRAIAQNERNFFFEILLLVHQLRSVNANRLHLYSLSAKGLGKTRKVKTIRDLIESQESAFESSLWN